MNTDSPKTPAAILKAALAREQEAYEFYDQMTRNCKVEMVLELLETLKNEESRHLRLVQGMIAKMELD